MSEDYLTPEQLQGYLERAKDASTVNVLDRAATADYTRSYGEDVPRFVREIKRLSTNLWAASSRRDYTDEINDDLTKEVLAARQDNMKLRRLGELAIQATLIMPTQHPVTENLRNALKELGLWTEGGADGEG